LSSIIKFKEVAVTAGQTFDPGAVPAGAKWCYITLPTLTSCTMVVNASVDGTTYGTIRDAAAPSGLWSIATHTGNISFRVPCAGFSKLYVGSNQNQTVSVFFAFTD
jgi:hypothetical protein